MSWIGTGGRSCCCEVDHRPSTMDTVDSKTRSQIMASVGQRNTTPEMLLRRALHKLGLRYRLHDRKLPGSPDLVFPRYKAVIFVHGCFWHRHGCKASTRPETRQQFWIDKFKANARRDQKNNEALLADGWRVLIVWECALKGKNVDPNLVAKKVGSWLRANGRFVEYGGPNGAK